MKYALTCLLFLATLFLAAQKQPLTYYLPDIEYNSSIPTPESVLGHQIGEWHLSHGQQLYYMRLLADASPRVSLTEYARTYENRPLVYLTITSEENHQNLEAIREAHLALSNPAASRQADVGQSPVVLYQGFSIHGNEASGGNAAPLVAYYLAAGQSEEVQNILRQSVILLDPCFNPDGFQRFSSWVNMHKNANLTPDPQDREYDEAWPGGRTNHYWFDLNRDWLPVQHPESQGRIRTFHAWKPNILTDHHEMGTNSTFFFMPGIPQRTNPITPPQNQVLTGEIGKYHAQALNDIGSLYYTKESFDDFYYGKGSTYPDANGGIGILFEQASARGHLQASENGVLSFPFTIRNQVATALSTQRAAIGLREKLLEYQRDFYRQGLEEARKDKRKAFVFGESKDAARLQAMVEILRRHQIKTYELASRVETNGQAFEPASSYIVPLEQEQYRLIRGIFDTTTTFQDSIFYDVSSWAFPLSFNIPYAALNGRAFSKSLLGEAVQGLGERPAAPAPERSDYAYLLEWENYFAPKALNFLMQKGLRAKVSTKDFRLEGRDFRKGTVLIPVQNQNKPAEEIHQLAVQATEMANVGLIAVGTGLSQEGIDLGSPSFEPLEAPKVMILVGEGVSGYEAGEVWHLLDQRYGITASKVELSDADNSQLEKYNAIVMVDGSYSGISKAGWDKLRQWVREGGTLIAIKDGARYAQQQGLAQFKTRKSGQDEDKGRRPYEKLDADRGSERIGGAIMQVEADLSHPLFFGYQRSRLPVFRRGTLAFEPAENPYASPAIYLAQPLLSGYAKESNRRLIAGSAAVAVSGLGGGRTICLADNPNFRAFWYGTNPLFANALFFGRVISGNAVERASGKPAN